MSPVKPPMFSASKIKHRITMFGIAEFAAGIAMTYIVQGITWHWISIALSMVATVAVWVGVSIVRTWLHRGIYVECSKLLDASKFDVVRQMRLHMTEKTPEENQTGGKDNA